MQQAVDAFLDLDERAVVGEVADLALDDGVGRVLLGHARPGVGLDLLHAEADFLLVLVDVQDDDLDLVAEVDQLGRMVDPPGPAHLADVHQALDARLELHERAVVDDVDHLALDPRADRVALLDPAPTGSRSAA